MQDQKHAESYSHTSRELKNKNLDKLVPIHMLTYISEHEHTNKSIT